MTLQTRQQTIQRGFLGLALAALVSLAGLGAVSAAEEGIDWTHWRGPSRTGITAENGWAKNWPKVRVAARWKRDLGPGYSSMAVKDGRLYTMGYSGGSDVVYCLSTKTGKAVWGYKYPARNFDNMNKGGPSATPSLWKDRVYTISRDASLHCLSAPKGKALWKHDLKQLVSAKPPTWGFSGSPLIHEGHVIVDVGRIVCLDATSGKLVWKTEDFGGGYSSPIPFTHNKTTLLATFPGYGLVIVKPKTGAVVAKFRWDTNYKVNAATPIIMGDRIFISSGYNKGCAMLKFDGKSLTELWSNRNMRNHMASCIWIGDHLYGFDNALLTCISAETGEVAWKERGLGKGSLIAADGKLIVLAEKGEVQFAPASPKGYKAVARQHLLSGDGVWTAPVLSNGQLYVRSPTGELVCARLK